MGARHSGVHTQTVHLWVRRGYFPVYKETGHRAALIDRDEADLGLGGGR